jgi:Legionella pneumophila major outer membrane protein precursor
MVRLTRVLLVGAALLAAEASQVRGQAPASRPDSATATPTPSTAASGEPVILQTLPQVPDAPRSLFAPAPLPGPMPPDAEGPYFQCDPMIDPPPLPQPGWFFDLDLDPTKAHVKNEISTPVLNPATGSVDIVGLPSATLNWTIAPRFELGYRLPSGFGEFLIAYRFLATDGSEAVTGADGPARLSSLLDINQVDFDYASREVSLWRLFPDWDLRWWVGLRYAYVYFDSRQGEAFDLAAAGSGVYQTRVTDSFVGIGPHAGFEVARHFGSTGLAFVSKADFALLVGRVRQQFFEHTTAFAANGQPLIGAAGLSDSQGVPVLEVQAGLSWQPPRFPQANFFLGYRYEYWWEVGRVDDAPIEGSFGEIIDQGFVLRAEFNF